MHIPLALWSGYRAIVQVQRLELSAGEPVLRDGSAIRVDVVSSGRATIDVSLEVVQGARSATLDVQQVPTSRNPAYDPRFKRASMAVVLTPELVGRFTPGPAIVRATARGRSQWLRTPPPEIREVEVEIGQLRR